MNTSIKFCPACKKDCLFEWDEADSYCSECGRTEAASVSAVKAEVLLKRAKISKWIWLIAGLPLLVGLGFILAPGAAIGAIAQVFGMALILAPILGALALYRFWKRSK